MEERNFYHHLDMLKDIYVNRLQELNDKDGEASIYKDEYEKCKVIIEAYNVLMDEFIELRNKYDKLPLWIRNLYV